MYSSGVEYLAQYPGIFEWNENIRSGRVTLLVIFPRETCIRRDTLVLFPIRFSLFPFRAREQFPRRR